MAGGREFGSLRRLGRKRSRVRVRLIVYAVFLAVTLAAALAGLAVNKHIEQVWDEHLRWLESQPAAH
jgi:hypothetical protein